MGRWLRQARTAKDISQKRLGILAGMDEFTASVRINQIACLHPGEPESARPGEAVVEKRLKQRLEL